MTKRKLGVEIVTGTPLVQSEVITVSASAVLFLLVGKRSPTAAFCVCVSFEIEEFDAQKTWEDRELSEILLTEEHTDSSHIHPVCPSVRNKDTT